MEESFPRLKRLQNNVVAPKDVVSSPFVAEEPASPCCQDAGSSGAPQGVEKGSILFSEDRTRCSTSDQLTLTNERGAAGSPHERGGGAAAFGDQYAGRTWSVGDSATGLGGPRLDSVAEEQPLDLASYGGGFSPPNGFCKPAVPSETESFPLLEEEEEASVQSVEIVSPTAQREGGGPAESVPTSELPASPPSFGDHYSGRTWSVGAHVEHTHPQKELSYPPSSELPASHPWSEPPGASPHCPIYRSCPIAPIPRRPICRRRIPGARAPSPRRRHPWTESASAEPRPIPGAISTPSRRRPIVPPWPPPSGLLRSSRRWRPPPSSGLLD